MSEGVADAAIISIIIWKRKKRRIRNKKARKVWVKSWRLRRPQLGIYDTLLSELRVEEESDDKTFLRMTSENFEEIFHLIERV